MKLAYKQLSGHLANTLSPIYCVSGDEELLIQEVVDAIYQRATSLGFTERITWHTGSGFDWQQFTRAAQTYSLFNSQTFLKLHLTDKRLSEEGITALQAFANDPPADKCLLIITAKLTAAQLKSRWLQAIDKHGVIVQVAAIKTFELAVWIKQRLNQAGFTTDSGGLQLLHNSGEGNLLLLAQMIAKLSLLYSPGKLSSTEIAAVITDGAHYDIFALSDGVLQGDMALILRILLRLQQEGTEALLVLWALARELRALNQLSFAVSQGQTVDQALTEQGLWQQRKPMIKKALSRYSLAQWRGLLEQAKHIDGIVKGVMSGNAWNELQQLALAIAGGK